MKKSAKFNVYPVRSLEQIKDSRVKVRTASSEIAKRFSFNAVSGLLTFVLAFVSLVMPVKAIQAGTATLKLTIGAFNYHGGAKAASDFNIQVQDQSGTTIYNGSQDITVASGTYTITVLPETAYFYTYFGSCNGMANDGDSLHCTVGANDSPAQATVTTLVSGGGSANPSDFTITATGTNPTPATFAGSNAGTVVQLDSGIYSFTSSAVANYSVSYSSGCTGTAVIGGTISCAITATFNSESAGQADIVVSKTSITPFPAPGGQIIYIISVANHGPQAATGVKVTDILPAGLTLDSHFENLGTFNPATGVWTVGNLIKGQATTMSIVANISSDLSAEQHLINTATGTSDLQDPDTSNNTGTSNVILGSPLHSDLSILKTVDKASPKPGDTVVYTLVVKNTGPDDANGVTVSDTLPSSVAFVSSTATQGSYDSSASLWTIGTLANGDTATATITTTVNANAAGQVISNTAVASAVTADPNIENNSSTATATVTSSSGGGDGEGQMVTLTVSTSAAEGAGGTVTSDVGGINCGQACSQSYNSGTVITLTANPDANSSFTGTWTTGPCSGSDVATCTFTLTSNTSANAHFSLKSSGSSGGGSSGGGPVPTSSGGSGIPVVPKVLGLSISNPSSTPQVAGAFTDVPNTPKILGAATELPRTGMPFWPLSLLALLISGILAKKLKLV